MSKSLVRLIDYSLLPFSLTILGKVFGLYFVLSLLGIDWGVGDFPGSFISATPIVYGKDLVAVSTYSNLIMFVLVFSLFAIQVAITQLRQQSLTNTQLLRRLLSLPKVNAFERGLIIYSRLYVWFAYIWLITVYIFIDTMIGRTQPWLMVVSLGLSILTSIVLIKNTTREYTVSKVLKF